MVASRVSSIYRPGLFSGKSAIVTGGGTGIGCSIAQELLSLGCKVMIASRKLEVLEESASKMKKLIGKGNKAELHVTDCNIRDEDQVKKMVSKAVNQFGHIDILVNNGGGQFPAPAESISLKGWKAVVETNLTGTFLCCKEVYLQSMKENGGVIVNIIADMFKGMPLMSHSGAARAGVDNLTKTLALEWASSGVRVNCVSPGSSVYSPTAADNYKTFNVFDLQIPRIPAKRLAKTEEISAAVCFLCSPAAAFITGETLKVDGGQVLYTTSIPWEVPDHDKFPVYSWDDEVIGNTDDPEDTVKSKL